MAVHRNNQAYRPVVVLLAFSYYWFTSTTRGSVNLFREQGNKKSHGHIGPCTELSSKIFDCSNRNLRDIPNNTFPEGLVKLDLSRNAFTRVNSGTFQKQSLLYVLDLSYNHITQLEPGAFMGLLRLRRLSLGYNSLILSNTTYTETLMKDLVSLEVLQIEGNTHANKSSKSVSCPVKALQKLPKLRKLYTDIPKEIDIGICFAGLVQLKILSSVGTNDGCEVPRLTNSTFESFQGNLTKLCLINCGIQEMELGVFFPLKNLDVLDLTDNIHLTLTKAFHGLYSLQGLIMTSIKLKYVNPSKWSAQTSNHVLSGNMTRYIQNICVRHVDISSNFVYHFDEVDVPRFNKSCLEKFRMRRHCLTSVPTRFILEHMVNNEVLKDVDVSDGTLRQIATGLSEGHTSHIHTASVEKKSDLNRPPINLTVKWLNMSQFIPEVVSLQWITTHLDVDAKILRVLDASYNNIRGCTYAVSGLSELSVLNISGSECSKISPKLFTDFETLRVLVFRDSLLNVGFADYEKGDVFKSLANLQEIDLSENDFETIHQNIFTPLRKLTKVLLRGNKFDTVPAACLGVPKLQYLDISDNFIPQLNKHDMDRFDQFNIAAKAKNTSFSLALSGNPLACTCDTQDFIGWIFTTKINMIYNDRFHCTLNNGSIVTLESLKGVWAEFQTTCASMLWLKLAISGLVVLVLAIILGALGYRNRWHLRYWFRTSCRNDYEPIPENFDYDGFVCYNHEDYKWVFHRLRTFLEDGHNHYKLCLHHRDFMPGEGIQQNIVDAINCSRKIILVITEKFIQCDWGEYEIEMAGMRSVRDGSPNLIIAILLEDMPVSKMPKVVLNLWQRITFLTWPHTRQEQAIFWERLVKAMR